MSTINTFLYAINELTEHTLSIHITLARYVAAFIASSPKPSIHTHPRHSGRCAIGPVNDVCCWLYAFPHITHPFLFDMPAVCVVLQENTFITPPGLDILQILSHSMAWHIIHIGMNNAVYGHYPVSDIGEMLFDYYFGPFNIIIT